MMKKMLLILLLIVLLTISLISHAEGAEFGLKEMWSVNIAEADSITKVTSMDYGDVDGDGHPDIGVVCVKGPVYSGYDGDSESYLYVIKSDGTLLFKRKLSDYGFKNSARSISLSDIDNDGKCEIIVGGGILIGGPLSLIAFDDDGSKLWSFTAPIDMGDRATAHYLATVDIDNDSKLEIFEATGDWESSISRMFDTNGSLIWQKTFGEVSQLGVADINGDGKPEFLLGTSLGANPRTLFVFDWNGSILWKKTFVGYVNFVVNDVTGDGKPEIIVCAGDTDTSWEGQLVVLRSDGSVMYQSEIWYGLDAYLYTPLAIDLDGDGIKDIVISRPHQRLGHGIYNTLITAYRSTGSTFEKLWSFTVKTPYLAYPTLFKYNGKEYPLVIGTNGTIYKLNGDGTLEEFLNVPYSSYKWCRFPLWGGWYEATEERTKNPVFISVDLDGDGLEEIPMVVEENGNVYLKIFKIYHINPKIEVLRRYLEMYKDKVVSSTKQWIRNMARADAMLYKRYGDSYADLVIKFYGCKAGKVCCDELPDQFLADMNKITQRIEIYENRTIMNELYEFYKEMFGKVNLDMSSQEIEEVFYQYYMGTYPGQEHYIFVDLENFLREYERKYDNIVNDLIYDLSQLNPSEEELDTLINGVKKSISEIEVPINDTILADAIIQGKIEQLVVAYNELHSPLLPLGFISAISGAGGSILSSKILLAGVLGLAAFGMYVVYDHSIASTTTSTLTTTGPLATGGMETASRGVEIDIQKSCIMDWIQKKLLIDIFDKAKTASELLEKVQEASYFEKYINIEEFVVNDANLDQNGEWAYGSGYIVIRNDGDKDVIVALKIRIDGPSAASIAIKDKKIKIKAGRSRTVYFDYSVEVRSLREKGVCSMYYTATAFVEYYIMFSPGVPVPLRYYPGIFASIDLPISIPVAKVSKTTSINFKVIDTGADCISTKIVEGTTIEGEVTSTNVIATGDTTVIQLPFGGSDLDLHIYDQLGRHVGVNYQTGEIETEIPGVEYSGSAANPEWIKIYGHRNEEFTVKIVAVATEGTESYTLLMTTINETPPIITVIPSQVSLDIVEPGTYSIPIFINELGGFHGTELTIEASDLISNSVNISDINVTPSKKIHLDPRGSAKINYIVNVSPLQSHGIYRGYLIIYDKNNEISIIVNVTLNYHQLIYPLASFTVTPPNPAINQVIIFNASSSYDPDGLIVSYRWNFGDGNVTTTTDKIVTHTYTSPGNYTVTLTVTDNDGLSSSISKVIQVISVNFSLTVDQKHKTTTIGVNASYILTLTNTGNVFDNYTITIDNPDNAVVWLSKSEVGLHPGESVTIILNVTAYDPGEYRVNVTVTSEKDPSKIAYINTTTKVELPTGMYISPKTLKIPVGGKKSTTIRINLCSDDGIGREHTITIAFYNATTKRLTTKINGSLSSSDVNLEAEYDNGIIYYYWTPTTAGTYEFTLTLWFEEPVSVNDKFTILISDDYVAGDEIIAVVSGEAFAYPIPEVITSILVGFGMLVILRRLVR